MKKITTLFMMLMAAVMTLSMSSCTEDQLIGMDLEGTWEGETYARHAYGGQVYQSSRTVVKFVSDWNHFTEGTGYWADYYSSSPWGREYIANNIRWKVKDKNIYIHFVEDNYDVVIYDYSISHGYFEGYIYTEDSDVHIRLHKTSDPNWNDYYYGYGYLYSRETRAGSNEAIEVPKRLPFGDAEE